MGERTGLFQGLATILADTLMEVSGHLLVRTYSDQAAGTVDLAVDGLHRWPDSGRVIIERESYTYTSVTRSPSANSLEGLEHASGAAGLVGDVRKGTPVTYYGGDFSDVEKMARSFFVQTAEGSDLDIYARNFGLFRPRGMDDETFRALLMVIVYVDATTIHACEKVLDAIVGAGLYDVWDDPLDPEDHHKVFVLLDAEGTDVYRGKTFLCGGEAQPSTGATTVDTTYDPVVVYGIYEDTTGDPSTDRQTNANLLNQAFGGFTDATHPTYLQTSVDVFTASDLGQTIALDGTAVWEILAVVSARAVALGRQGFAGRVSLGSPQALTCDGFVFRSWMEGHTIQVTSAANSGNYQTATIDSVVSTSLARLSFMSGGGWVASDTSLVFSLIPAFSVTFPSFQIPRYTLAGNTVTTVNTLPANVFVDYATIPSAQLCTDHTQSGNAQYPLYLFDDSWYVESILDLILAAGCHPVV